MTPRQQERLKVYQKVVEICDENPLIITGQGKAVRFLHGFRISVASITCIDYITGSLQNLHGLPSDELSKLILPLMEGCARCLQDLTSDREDTAIKQRITYAMAHLRVSSQDIRSAAFVSLLELIDELVSSLDCYGINDSVILALKIIVESYLGVAPTFSLIAPEVELYQASFRNVLHTANVLFKDCVDSWMEEVAGEHYKFYQSYRRLRMYAEINYLL